MKIMLDEGAQMPTRAHPTDAGLDLYAAEPAFIRGGSYGTIRTGVHVEIPEWCVGLLTSKSGLMSKKGITSRGTIDCGYTGEIKVTLYNSSEFPYSVHKGDKISQLVILPILTPELEIVSELDDTARGDNGFGSTGR